MGTPTNWKPSDGLPMTKVRLLFVRHGGAEGPDRYPNPCEVFIDEKHQQILLPCLSVFTWTEQYTTKKKRYFHGTGGERIVMELA